VAELDDGVGTALLVGVLEVLGVGDDGVGEEALEVGELAGADVWLEDGVGVGVRAWRAGAPERCEECAGATNDGACTTVLSGVSSNATTAIAPTATAIPPPAIAVPATAGLRRNSVRRRRLRSAGSAARCAAKLL
jgi:hypothetical protein